MEQIFRLFDFNVYNNKDESDNSSNEEKRIFTDSSTFKIQMFGLNEKGETCSIIVENFQPFFYVLVEDHWDISMKNDFIRSIKTKIGKFYENSIKEKECIIVKRKKLYGFDAGKEYKFIKLVFSNMNAFNKTKNLWYSSYNEGHKLLKKGYLFQNTYTELYEANIPALLRFFHIKDISPSGWIALPNKTTREIKGGAKSSTCTFEFIIDDYKSIRPLNDKESMVPYKICSFDIEASSSHGDFPIPVKSYKKLATNIVDYFNNLLMEITPDLCKNILKRILLAAFGYENMEEIDIVYPKSNQLPKNRGEIEEMTEKWLNLKFSNQKKNMEKINTIEKLFHRVDEEEDVDDDNEFIKKGSYKTTIDKNATIVDILCNKKIPREEKINEINISLTPGMMLDSSSNKKSCIFPELEGDKVTFIGSTFIKYGEVEPYLNHCIALNTCDELPAENTVIESYTNEKDVLLAWQKLIQKENPDIIIGYNIFGFDYQFMFKRAEELECVEDFLKLARNKDEICANKAKDANGKEMNFYKLEESTIQIASGQHDLRYIKMNGRLQIDLYNYFRREENLTSYKLDYVAGHFIGDYIKNVSNNGTLVKTTNLTGLSEDSYIHFEEIGHSIDYYENGAKFKVLKIIKENSEFIIESPIVFNENKKMRWCLAKDDVTPKDIFRMTNGSSKDRAVIAKYCIQDCNLVQNLLRKVDVITGYVEMAKICSVPISFLVMRGQGIKLTSYIAKKCREKSTLIPVLEKGSNEDGYEGAIVLDPKCDLYLDNPVACVDYASLYPSSMISENLSHDSKVWTKEFDLHGNLIGETGIKNEAGEFIYDDLPNYEYVNITYDTYKYVRKTPSAAAEKIKSGKKICRFAQFPESKGKAIMPSILEELLVARKSTRKLIPLQTDDFMKNVLDKRQLGYKVTANSLYGQCGAITSTFYEQDVAASTTATGRLLLTYAKRMIEETYGNAICQTEKYGPVLSKAEYIYGDTDSVFFTFNLQTPDGKPIRGKEALEITIELAQEAGHLASKFLKKPHDLEYEKTFMPFCLLSKKRYVGMLYEHDPNKCKRKEMGIVLKRRDNAPIVKDIYGGIIDILMKEKDIQKAIDFLRNSLQNIIEEKYPMDKLVITKSLRSGYKNPNSIAHKVLADRITARDPGNKPSSGDRIPFVYINNSNKKALQGEKIETPTFIKENSLKIDYSFYITNQIMKPVQQLFALVLEKIWEMQSKKKLLSKFKKDVESLKKTTPEDKFEGKLEQFKNKEVKKMLFDEYLRETNNGKDGNQSLMKFFIKK